MSVESTSRDPGNSTTAGDLLWNCKEMNRMITSATASSTIWWGEWYCQVRALSQVPKPACTHSFSAWRDVVRGKGVVSATGGCGIRHLTQERIYCALTPAVAMSAASCAPWYCWLHDSLTFKIQSPTSSCVWLPLCST